MKENIEVRYCNKGEEGEVMPSHAEREREMSSSDKKTNLYLYFGLISCNICILHFVFLYFAVYLIRPGKGTD